MLKAGACSACARQGLLGRRTQKNAMTQLLAASYTVTPDLSARRWRMGSVALAVVGRGVSLVLDERKVCRMEGNRVDSGAVLSTLQLILASDHRRSWSAERVRDLVSSAGQNGRMGAPKEDSALLVESMRS